MEVEAAPPIPTLWALVFFFRTPTGLAEAVPKVMPAPAGNDEVEVE
jgi:hypothetical protein